VYCWKVSLYPILGTGHARRIEREDYAASQSKPTKMIVLSDGDILRNQVGADGSPYPLGYDHYTQQSYGNKNLLLNIADYMTDDSGLISNCAAKKYKCACLDRARIREEKLFWQIIKQYCPWDSVNICYFSTLYSQAKVCSLNFILLVDKR
jgi:hypothetical protein